MELPYEPAVPLLYKYPEKIKTLIQKDTCAPMFTAALFTITKSWRQPSDHQQMDGLRRGGVYMQWTVNHKREQNFAICKHGWTRSVSEREKTITICYHLYVESEK